MDYEQKIITDWARRCFGSEQVEDPEVRGLRLLEEAVEYAQAVGVGDDVAVRLVNYIYSRPAGNPAQELGGVEVCALAAASSIGVSLSECRSQEIQRVTAKSPEHFTERNQQKVDLGFTSHK